MGCATLEDKNSGGQVIYIKPTFEKIHFQDHFWKDPLLEERLPMGLP
jgi:hypothetical protein